LSLDYWRRWPVPLTFEKPGDKAEGVIVAEGDPRQKWPEIHVRQDDGIVRIVRVTQTKLREKVGVLAPCQGDWIKIVYIGDAKKAAPGMNPTKEFTVEVRRVGSGPQVTDSAALGKGASAVDGGPGGRK
jgi:hypothetical protein